MFLSDAEYGLSITGPGPLLNRYPLPHVGASKAGQDYSELGVLVPDGIADFTGRSASEFVDVNVSDTASISATESPVDTQEIATTDSARLRVTESAQVFRFMSATDTARLDISETVSLNIAGVNAKAGSDTASLSLSESVSIAVSVAVTDDAELDVTDTASVATTVDSVDVTDTASLEITDLASIDVFVGVVEKSVADIARLSTTESASAIEVRRIKRIALSVTQPRIEIEIN